MTKLEVIRTIGDLLTELDVQRGSLLPNDPNRHLLDAVRNELDDRQRELAKASLQEGSPRYQALTVDLAAANADVKRTLTDVKKFAETLNALGRILAVVDSLIKTALSVI